MNQHYFSDLPEQMWEWDSGYDLATDNYSYQPLPGFLELVLEMEREYLAQEGYVTCEFSSSTLTPEKLNILADSNLRLHNLGAVWYVFECETCRSYNSDRPYHVEIYRDNIAWHAKKLAEN